MIPFFTNAPLVIDGDTSSEYELLFQSTTGFSLSYIPSTGDDVDDIATGLAAVWNAHTGTNNHKGARGIGVM